ncbi:MAG: hypothetical protein Q8P50_02605 [Bacillota bacterium]|nr:hypothetical protein [Bacillota bacterium]
MAAVNQALVVSMVIVAMSAGVVRSASMLSLSIRHIRSAVCGIEAAICSPELRWFFSGQEELPGASGRAVVRRRASGIEVSVPDPGGSRRHVRIYAPVALR